MSNVGYFDVDIVDFSLTQYINIILISFVEVDVHWKNPPFIVKF